MLSRRPTAGAPKRAITHLSELSGGKFTRQLLVDSSKGTTFLKPLDVYSTPAMIWDMEWHVRELIFQIGLHGSEGWDSVGTRVEFSHTAATVIGARVTLVTEVTEVDVNKRRVVARTTFSDALGELGHGVHERAVVKMGKVNERIAARKAELDAREQ